MSAWGELQIAVCGLGEACAQQGQELMAMKSWGDLSPYIPTSRRTLGPFIGGIAKSVPSSLSPNRCWEGPGVWCELWWH